MVKGIDIFRERLGPYAESFVLIGGAACDDWFTTQGLPFRATNDLDIVLVIEELETEVIGAFRSFIDEGGYKESQRSDETPILYRFAKPSDQNFPVMLELFSRNHDPLDLAPDQTVIPIVKDEGSHSLSAILLDNDYYTLLREHQNISNGLPFANASSLIPLKARAWIDLSQRKANGERVDSKDIKKHRSDVFKLVATLPGDSGPEVAQSIRRDLADFLSHFPANSTEWPAIFAALKTSFGKSLSGLKPETLIETLVRYYQLPSEW